MEKYFALNFLPQQTVGEETATTTSVQVSNETEASLLFESACKKLADINNWGKICGAFSADFALINDDGTLSGKKPIEGNYIRIDIPGPGPKNGGGYDWVKIEKIKLSTISPAQKIFLIQARPANAPRSNNNGIAHFLTDKATSSFVIMLDNTTITAGVFGRNEVPNTEEVNNMVDKIRNAIVGSSGAIGVSKLQWKALVKGVLDK